MRGRYTSETRPILEYYAHQDLVHKIDGTREVDTVWLDSQEAIATIESRFTAACAPAAPTTCVHVYGDEGKPTEDLVCRIIAAAAERFGEGMVSVNGRTLQVCFDLMLACTHGEPCAHPSSLLFLPRRCDTGASQRIVPHHRSH